MKSKQSYDMVHAIPPNKTADFSEALTTTAVQQRAQNCIKVPSEC
jgi:hypothetical protein